MIRHIDALRGAYYLMSAPGNQKFADIYRRMTINKFVMAGQMKIPTIAQTKEFFAAAIRGMEYAERVYGNDAIPDAISVRASCRINNAEKRECVMFAVLEGGAGNRIIFTYYYLAKHASHLLLPNGQIAIVDDARGCHLPEGKSVSAYDLITLHFFEECVHCYQVVVEKRMPAPDAPWREDPLEKEAEQCVFRAIADLRITLYPR